VYKGLLNGNVIVRDALLVGDMRIPDKDTLHGDAEAAVPAEKQYTNWICGVDAVEGKVTCIILKV
jgi:hypothetical protein